MNNHYKDRSHIQPATAGGVARILSVGNGVNIASEVRDGMIFASGLSEISSMGLGKQGISEPRGNCPIPICTHSAGKFSRLYAME
jgi:hypothetical protein